MRSTVRVLLPAAGAAAMIAAGLLTAPTANAQAQAPAAGQSNPTQNIPDQKLDATAAAMQQVASLRKQYRERLEGAPVADKDRIADEGNGALVRAVTDQGLSVDEYSTIVQIAQNDRAVRDNLLERLRPDAK
jgi:Spy/CpxP family protein refolding chaperone